MKNKNLMLKLALLSCCIVTGSINAITGNIPEMAKTFSDQPLYVIELVSTIPPLFQMAAILFAKFISGKIGYKNNMIMGIVLCGIGGVIPMFIQNIYVILITRAVYGIGGGIIIATLLTLIVYFFEGDERSNVIGLQGAAGGLSSLITAFVSGQLLSFGWNVSYAVYFIAFPVLLLVFLFIPKVTGKSVSGGDKAEENESKGSLMGLIGLAVLLFVSVLVATLFVIKGSTLVTSMGYGTVQDGSMVIMLISFGSLCAGVIYGKMYSRMRKLSLPVFYLLLTLSFVLAGFSDSLLLTLVSAFIMGFAYLAFIPYIQDLTHKCFHNFGETATSVILVFQSLGAFAAPYLGNILAVFSQEITVQFFITAGICAVLTLISVFMAKTKKA